MLDEVFFDNARSDVFFSGWKSVTPEGISKYFGISICTGNHTVSLTCETRHATNTGKLY